MKNIKKVLSAVLVIAILVLTSLTTQPVSSTGYTDVKSTSWYYTYVNKLVSLNITAGVGYNKFAPNNSVTKAEFVTFLCKATGLKQEDGYTFTDTTTHWGKGWISAAVTANIIDEGTAFNPNKAITRQEVAEMLCRTLGLSEDLEMLTPYSDVTKDEGYSNRAYEEYLMLGSVTNNKRYFYPASDIKRSEVSAVIVNLVDYKKDAESYKATKKAEIAEKEKAETAAQEEAERYAEWKESVKGVSSKLLNNTDGLYKSSYYESYKQLIDDKGYFVTWGKKFDMTEEEVADEVVRVGCVFANAIGNENYKNTNAFATSMKEVYDIGNIDAYLTKKFNYMKINTLVTDGKFLTSTGLIVYGDDGLIQLRGTLKYRYLSPTSSDILNSEIVSNTGKASKINTWYEQDFKIEFVSTNACLKVTNMRSISKIRLAQ